MRSGWHIALLCLGGLLLGPATRLRAQEDALTAATERVRQTTAAWRAAAQDLDARVARMLPCDPKAKPAIDEASRASQTRLAAQSDYYAAALLLISTRTEGAKRLLASEEARTADIAGERAQAEKAVQDIRAQGEELAAAAQKRPALNAAQASLKLVQAAALQRAALAQEQAGEQEPVLSALRQLVQGFQNREAALKQEEQAFQAERTRWNGYYAARLARSQMECSVVNGVPALSPAPAKPKPARTPAKGKAK